MLNKQLLYTCPTLVFDDESLTIDELKIYMVLHFIMDASCTVYASSQWIANRLNLNQRHVISCVYSLIDKGCITWASTYDRKILRIHSGFVRSC